MTTKHVLPRARESENGAKHVPRKMLVQEVRATNIDHPSPGSRKKRVGIMMKSEDTMSFHAPDPEDDDNISLCSCLLRLPQMAEIIKAFSDDETLKSLACRYVWWLMRQKPPAAMSNLWVAELAKKRWNKKLVPEKVKLIQDKYRRPASCPTVCSLTVNDPEIWAQLQHYQRRVDLTVANIQQTVRKAALLSLKTANALVNTKEPDQTTTDKISWLHSFTGPCQLRALRAS